MSKPARFDWLFRPQMADVDLPLSAEGRFAEALAELPAVERSALALSEIGGLETDEIAERLGTEPAVVQKLLARARESVRASLSATGRRGLAALLPLQSVWQPGASGSAVRAAGVVAAAVVAPSVLIGGAAADAPHARAIPADPPVVGAAEDTRHTVAPVTVRTVVAPAAVVAIASKPVAASRRSPAQPTVRALPGRAPGPVAPAAQPPQQPTQRVPVAPVATPEPAREPAPQLESPELSAGPVPVPPVPVSFRSSCPSCHRCRPSPCRSRRRCRRLRHCRLCRCRSR